MSDEDVRSGSVGANSAIEVFARLRPSARLAKQQYTIGGTGSSGTAGSSLAVNLPRDAASGLVNNSREKYDFKFNGIFDESARQEHVFDAIAKPVVQSVLDGYNGTIFAYGQTGSGKTFTMTGGPDRYDDRGIIPRALSFIFAAIASNSAYRFSVSVSYLEIYNNDGYDLLSSEHETKRLDELPKVSMREDDAGNVHMSNIGVLPTASVDEALNLLFVGDTNRIICETPSNDASSRSHCIFSIYVEARELNGSRIRRSKLHLVDLAGSERVKKTQIAGKILTEALHINLALHYLEQVIIALHKRARDKQVHIPYRNSMMTSVLRDSLGGNCRTVMIATFSGQSDHLDETISTCRFAQRVAMVTNIAMVNEEEDPSVVIRRLRAQLRELKEEVCMLRGEQPAVAPLDDEQRQRMRALARSFCDRSQQAEQQIGTDAGHPSKLRALFDAFREMVLAAESASTAGNERSVRRTAEPKDGKAVQSSAEIEVLRSKLTSRENQLSSLLAVLRASADPQHQRFVTQFVASSEPLSFASPSPTPAAAPRRSPPAPVGANMNPALSLKQQQALEELHARVADAGAPLSADRSLLEARNAAFDQFRQSYKRNQVIEEQKESLRSKIDEAKAVGEAINVARNNINSLKASIEQRRMQRGIASSLSARGGGGGGGGGGPGGEADGDTDASAADPEEQALCARIDHEKGAYRDKFNALKNLKTEIEHLKALINRSRRKLQQDFDNWWEQQPQTQSPPAPTKQSADASVSGLQRSASNSSVNARLQSKFASSQSPPALAAAAAAVAAADAEYRDGLSPAATATAAAGIQRFANKGKEPSVRHEEKGPSSADARGRPSPSPSPSPSPPASAAEALLASGRTMSQATGLGSGPVLPAHKAWGQPPARQPQQQQQQQQQQQPALVAASKPLASAASGSHPASPTSHALGLSSLPARPPSRGLHSSSSVASATSSQSSSSGADAPVWPAAVSRQQRSTGDLVADRDIQRFYDARDQFVKRSLLQQSQQR